MLLTARTGALYEQCNHMGAQAPAFGSGKRCVAASLFLRSPGSREHGLPGPAVVAAPRWLARRTGVTAHLDPIIRPGLGAASAASSEKQEAGLGEERRGRESASATKAGRSTSRYSFPPGVIWALRVTLWKTPSVDLWGRAGPFLSVQSARGRYSLGQQMRGTLEEWSALGAGDPQLSPTPARRPRGPAHPFWEPPRRGLPN